MQLPFHQPPTISRINDALHYPTRSKCGNTLSLKASYAGGAFTTGGGDV